MTGHANGPAGVPSHGAADSRLSIMWFVRTTKPKAAAAARIGAELARRKRGELLELLRPCFARTGPWLQAGKYFMAVMSQIPVGRQGVEP
jgi:hypothetical protein